MGERQFVIALYSYNPTEEYALPLKEGETYEVLTEPENDEDGWIQVLNSEGHEGFVPRNYVGRIDVVEESQLLRKAQNPGNTNSGRQGNSGGSKNFIAEIMEKTTQPEWLVGDMSRAEAEAILKDYGLDGAFLIRNSLNTGEGFTLSVFSTKKSSVVHYHIRVDERGLFYLTSRQGFPALVDLVSYYKEFDAGLSVKLSNPPKDFKIYSEIQNEPEQAYYSEILKDMYGEGLLVVRAVRDYLKEEDFTLPMKKGETFKVYNADHHYWVEVVNTKEERGYVPKIYVEEVLKEDRPHGWFVGEMEGVEASDILKADGRDGSFLVRTSPRRKGYVLSLFSLEIGVTHYIVKVLEDGSVNLKGRKPFPTLGELIFYHQHNCSGMATRLKHIPKSIVDRDDVWNNRLWTLRAEDVSIVNGKTLGQGNFGEVKLGKLRGGTEVAIKIMKANNLREDDFLDEAKIMTKIHHENLVQLYGIFNDNGSIHIVTECMRMGSLLDYLVKNKNTLLKSCDLLLKMCKEICSGMAYLESRNYIHRDLAARNCLLGTETVVKICDFGLARYVIDDEYTTSAGRKMPIRWSSIEVLKLQLCSTKSDVWSYGVVMWEIFSGGDNPYGKVASFYELTNQIVNGLRLKKPDRCPLNVFKIMSSCWQEDPKSRPSFQRIKHELQVL